LLEVGLLFILLSRESEAEADFEQCRRHCPEARPYLQLLAEEARRRRQHK
jgi:hypothetical protein